MQGTLVTAKTWRCLLTAVAAFCVAFLAGPGAARAAAGDGGAHAVIVVGEDAPSLEALAAKELQRYLYELTGQRLDVVDDDGREGRRRGALVVLGQPDTNELIGELVARGELPSEQLAPGSEGYVIRTVRYRGREAIAVMGSDDNGTLYGSYELLERYGARFHIGRDVLPERRRGFAIESLDVVEEPAVGRRGLLPWHDFLNGPSGYSYEDFKSYIGQMTRMKMNTLVLHNYDGGYPAEDINEPFMDFECNGAHPDAWLDTSIDNERWGLAPFRTGDLAFDSGDYFPHDVMGSDAARYTKEQQDAQRYVFLKAKTMMQKVIRYAQERGMEVVLGTDFDILPASMRQAGCEPLDPAVLKARLDDILQTYPSLKYIQMYFNEVSQTSTAEAIEAYRVMRDYLAQKRPSARLLTGSWFQEPRFPEMDAALPKDITFSTLMPHDMTVRQEWADVARNRDAWPVPWMEFDGGLSEPQLAVGRMATQLPQLRRAGVAGVIGILWREQPAEANVAYLAQDLWQRPGSSLSAADFYRDYARHVLGPAAAERGAEAFQALESGGVYPSVGALPLTTPEYVGWSGWGHEQAPGYAAHYRELEATFRELGRLVTTASGRSTLEFYTEFMRWGSEYWNAQDKVPAAAVDATSSNYFLVNAGASQPEGDLRADHGYYGNTNTFTTSGTVENDFGYPSAIRSERWSSEVFGYRFDVPDQHDRYRVELYFQEGYFGVVVPGDPVGRRVFDIAINGTVVEEDFDPAEAAGGSLKGTRLVFDVPVDSGELDVAFVPVVSNPKIDIVRAYPIDADGNPLPEERDPARAVAAWEDIKASGFREAIDAYQHTVRDVPTLGGLLSAAGGRWYETASCGRCAPGSYKDFERQVVAELAVAPPDNLSARGTRSGASLTWRPHDGDASGVAGYHVYRRPASSGDFRRLTSEPVTATSYQGAADGEFVYAVSALDERGGESPLSYGERVQAGRADDVGPRVVLLPGGVEAVRGEPLRIGAVAVDRRVPEHVSVLLRYRRLGEGAWRSVPLRRSPLARRYAFFGEIPGREVRDESLEYYVIAGDGDNVGHAPAGAPAVTASAAVLARPSGSPGAVRGLTAAWRAERGGVVLSWGPAGRRTHAYRIYRSTGSRSGGWSYVTYVPSGQRVFVDANVEPGASYSYRVVPETIDDRTGVPRTARARVPAD